MPAHIADQRQAVAVPAARHRQVGHHHVAGHARKYFDEIGRLPGLGHDLDVAKLRERMPCSEQDDRMIVRDHDANRSPIRSPIRSFIDSGAYGRLQRGLVHAFIRSSSIDRRALRRLPAACARTVARMNGATAPSVKELQC